jgi:hypothetical protein
MECPNTSRPKVCEEERRQGVFTEASVEKSLSHNCSASRQSYACPNDRRCKDVFSRTEGPLILKNLRTLIWRQTPEGTGAPTLSGRRNNFVKLLKAMTRTTDNRIAFCIAGNFVCKSFFKVSDHHADSYLLIHIHISPLYNVCAFIYSPLQKASGMPSKSFDAAVAHVEDRESNKGVRVFDTNAIQMNARQRRSINTSRLTYTLAFFDAFFKGSIHLILLAAYVCLCVCLYVFFPDSFLFDCSQGQQTNCRRIAEHHWNV